MLRLILSCIPKSGIDVDRLFTKVARARGDAGGMTLFEEFQSAMRSLLVSHQIETRIVRGAVRYFKAKG